MAKEELLNEAQSEVVRAILRDLKRKHGKQEIVAELVGVSQQTISKYLREKDPPLIGLRVAVRMDERGLLDLISLRNGQARVRIPEPSDEGTMEESARARGLDPDDPDVRAQFGTAFREAKTRWQMLDSIAAGLRARKAAEKGRTATTHSEALEEGPLGRDALVGPKRKPKDKSKNG